MIDHYHTHKVRFASLRGVTEGDSGELIAPAIVLLVAGAAVLWIIQPSRSSPYSLWVELPGFLMTFFFCGLVFFVLSYAVEIVPKTALWLNAILGSVLALGSIVGTFWLTDQYADIEEVLAATDEDSFAKPPAWEIGLVFIVYGAAMSGYSFLLLKLREDS